MNFGFTTKRKSLSLSISPCRDSTKANNCNSKFKFSNQLNSSNKCKFWPYIGLIQKTSLVIPDIGLK